jgi:hypothetical protein
MPSQIRYKNSFVNISDVDVVLIVQLVNECIDSNSPEPGSWLATVREAWHHTINESGFGLMDLRLDELASCDARLREMITLLHSAVDRARSYSPVFSPEWANRAGLAGIDYLKAIPVQYVSELLFKLIGLLTVEGWDGQKHQIRG